MKVILGLILGGALCFAQEKGGVQESTAKYYRLDFTLKQVEGGKVTNARSYTTSVVTMPNVSQSEIRAGQKFVEAGPNGEGLSMNFGTNIDCRDVKQVGDRLALYVASEVSSLGVPDKEGAPRVVREMKWGGYVLIPLKKTVMIFSSDQPSSSAQMQMDVIATPLN